MYVKKKIHRIAIFIDEGNVWSSYKSLGYLFDYSKFKPFFEQKFSGELFKVFFYKAYPKDGTRDYSVDPQHKFMTYLKKELKFEIRKKELKTILQRDDEGNVIYNQKTGKPVSIEKGNFDVEITLDAQRFVDEYNIGVFFTGDSDFLPLISFLRNHRKKRVYVFSTKNSISTELRTGADGYFDLSNFPQLFGAKLEHRHKRNSSSQNEELFPRD